MPYSAAMNNPARVRSSWWRRLVFGADGLRVGWAVLLFALVSIAAVSLLEFIAAILPLPANGRGGLTPLGTITNEALLCAGVLIATGVMGLIEGRSWCDYGLRARHRAAHCAQGVLCGVGVLAAMLGALVLAGAAVVRFSGAGTGALVATGALWAIAFALTGATEELAFRGYLFFRLARGFNPWVAAIVSSLLFGVVHLSNTGESAVGITMVVCYGLVACLAVWRTGSLWWIIGVHAAWDWSESYLFGTADSGLAAAGRLLVTHPTGPAWLSGGSVGPEGSVLVFPAMLLLALCALNTAPRTRPATTPVQPTAGSAATGT